MGFLIFFRLDALHILGVCEFWEVSCSSLCIHCRVKGRALETGSPHYIPALLNFKERSAVVSPRVLLIWDLLHMEIWLFLHSSVLFNQSQRDLKMLLFFCTMYSLDSLCVTEQLKQLSSYPCITSVNASLITSAQ